MLNRGVIAGRKATLFPICKTRLQVLTRICLWKPEEKSSRADFNPKAIQINGFIISLFSFPLIPRFWSNPNRIRVPRNNSTRKAKNTE